MAKVLEVRPQAKAVLVANGTTRLVPYGDTIRLGGGKIILTQQEDADGKYLAVKKISAKGHNLQAYNFDRLQYNRTYQITHKGIRLLD